MNKNRNLTYVTLIVMMAVIAIIIVRACTQVQPPDGVFPEGPSVPTEAKPSLAFSHPVPGPVAAALQPILGYTVLSTSPDGTPPIKVAPFKNLQDQPYGSPEQNGGRTPVGLVEINIAPGVTTQRLESGVYVVMIDLASQEPVVSGQLSLIPTSPPITVTSTPITATSTPIITEAGTPIVGTNLGITFQRIPQIPNPARANSPYDDFKRLKPSSDIRATITPNGICFVVNTGGATSENPAYNLYCNQRSALGLPPSPFSFMDNFAAQYKDLQTSLDTAVNRLKEQSLLDQEANFQQDQIVSEKEDAQRLRDCAAAEQAGQAQENVRQACGSDIVIAPLEKEYFQRKLDAAKGQSTLPDGRFMLTSLLAPAFQQNNRVSVTAGALKILETIAIPNGTVQPGDYRVDIWYDIINGEKVFYAATITGVTTDNTVVTNQQIPAVPSPFINANESDPEPPPSQISAYAFWGFSCLFGECGP